MTKITAVGAALGAVLLGIMVIFAIWSGSGPRRLIPAAIGQPSGESEGSAGSPNHVTHHPILVLPKVSAEADGADSFSPAVGGARPTAPAEPNGALGRPDSMFPRTSFLPDPERLNSPPARNEAQETNSWLDGRPIRVPAGDWGTSPTEQHRIPLDLQDPPPYWQQRRPEAESLEPKTRHDFPTDVRHTGS